VELSWRPRLGQKGQAAELSGGVGSGVRMEGTTARLVVAADAFCCSSTWCRGGQGGRAYGSDAAVEQHPQLCYAMAALLAAARQHCCRHVQ